MPSRQMITIHPLYEFADAYHEGAVPESILPLEIMRDVRVENVTGIIGDRAINFLKGARHISEKQLSTLKRIKHGLVHRHIGSGDHEEREASRTRVEQVMACLRVIRPTREIGSMLDGHLEQEEFVIDSINTLHEMVEVPNIQKLYDIRLKDLLALQELAPRFLHAFATDCWRIKMATQFYQAGHFSSGNLWKIRYFLWTSALEALYTSTEREHNGKLVSCERIKFFLGEDTRIYSNDEEQYAYLGSPPQFTVGDLVGDCYKIRNFIAHGARIPDRWFDEGRSGLGEPVRYAEVLLEAASVMVRLTIIKILRDNLVEAFTPKRGADRYFASFGLTRSKLLAKGKIDVESDED